MLFLLGVWVLVRTVAGNPSLVDLVLGIGKSPPPAKSTPPPTPAAPKTASQPSSGSGGGVGGYLLSPSSPTGSFLHSMEWLGSTAGRAAQSAAHDFGQMAP